MDEQLLFPVLPYRIGNECSFPCLLEPCNCLGEDDKVLTDILKNGRIYAPLCIPSATFFSCSEVAADEDVQKKKRRGPRGGRGRRKVKENLQENKNVEPSHPSVINKTAHQKDNNSIEDSAPFNIDWMMRNPPPAPTPETQVENIQAKFQLELYQSDLILIDYKDELKRLQKALSSQSKGKHEEKSDHSKHLQAQICAIEAKIQELDLQKSSAKFGFERAGMCADPDIRRWREIFRLSSKLPALAKREEFEELIENNRFVVVMGQTGSGKSTQLAQYLADMPQFEKFHVICTQPRKIAAVTLAKRVAFEFSAGRDVPDGSQWVGHHVGGQRNLHYNNRIQFLTETVLLNQITQYELTNNDDPFRNCCAVIVDEAHSRTITTDVLLGVLKRRINQWPGLKVVVTSATIDTNLFSKYLFDCPVVEIPGRLYPVEVIYRPFGRDSDGITDAVVKQALDICNEHKTGDILCFLSGQNEVEWARQKFESSRNLPKGGKVVAYALYGKQPPEEQQKVFRRTPDEQKVIFATDIAETSITIDGVKFIVDSGMTKSPFFDSTKNITSLKETVISAASAEQRKGRAGRTGPGTCYRLYSEDDYNAMPKYDKAEIFLRPLGITVTLLKAMHVNPFEFEWLEPPDQTALVFAAEELTLLGALDHQQNLTPLGHLISSLQIDPGIARMIYSACSKGLGKTAAVLAGLFSVSSMVFWRGGDDETHQASNEAKKRFLSEQGDIVAIYKVFMEWQGHKQADRSLKIVKAWCMENFINNKAMNMAQSTAEEIETYLQRGAAHLWRRAGNQNRVPSEQDLQQLVAQAFVLNVAFLINKNYLALRSDVMTYIHPGSVFFRDVELPKVITFQNILRTSRVYAMQITPIDMEWIQLENGALFAFYEEKATRVNIHEVKIAPVSRGILRFILGPANRNVDKLNEELDCFLHGDYQNDALVAWCKLDAKNFVSYELKRRVEVRKKELELEVREDPLVGETRIVWGCGGEAKVLLFLGEFVGIRIHKVPSSWTLTDVDFIVKQKLSPELVGSIRNLYLISKASDGGKKTAKVIFDCPQKATTALKELKDAGKSISAGLDFNPDLGTRPLVYKESESWLNVNFAIAPSKSSAIIIYNTAKEANQMLQNRPINVQLPKKNALTDLQTGQNRNKIPQINCGLYVEPPMDTRMPYTLYTNRLPCTADEMHVEDEIVRKGYPKPPYVKIIRGDEIKIPMPSRDESAAWLNYAKAKDLLPISHKVIQPPTVRKDVKRKKITIHARYEAMDDIEMALVTRPNVNYHCDQFIRMEAEMKTSLRIEKELWEFRKSEIQAFFEEQKQKRVNCKIDNKWPSHTWLYIQVPRKESVDDIRKKIDDLLQFRFYKHQEIDLLFTHYGQAQMRSLKVESGYFNSHFPTKSIRIYGNEAERSFVKAQLDQLIRELEVLRVDVSFIIRKGSLSKINNLLPQLRKKNAGLRGEFRFFYNRLLATGTEEGIEELQKALKDDTIQPKNEVFPGDCGICFDELVNPVSLQLCAHKFCGDCVKHMMNLQVIPYPIICPVCQTNVCLKDIYEITSTSVLDKISQSAVAALVQKFPDKYRPCFKAGCDQYLPVRETPKEPNESEETRQGGSVVFCDQCNLHYCVTCSSKLKKPAQRHRGETCQQNQLQGNKDARHHRLYILDEICVLRCPRCKTAFIDFTGCCALTCSIETCKAGFCFFCLTDCGTDAHSHVRECPSNPRRGDIYVRDSEKNKVHRESRKAEIVKYLMSRCESRSLRSAVLHSIVRDLKDLDIIINTSEVGLAGYTQIADTAKYRDHILNEICTLRCPRCKTAFYEFEGCCAIECWNESCKIQFCFFCFADCGRDHQRAMAHVIKCPQNVTPGQLSSSSEKIAQVNKSRRETAIIRYLHENCSDSTERSAVLDSVTVNLELLGIFLTTALIEAGIPRRLEPPRVDPLRYNYIPNPAPRPAPVRVEPLRPAPLYRGDPLYPVHQARPYEHRPVYGAAPVQQPQQFYRPAPIPEPRVYAAPVPQQRVYAAPVPQPRVYPEPVYNQPPLRNQQRAPPPKDKCTIL